MQRLHPLKLARALALLIAGTLAPALALADDDEPGDTERLKVAAIEALISAPPQRALPIVTRVLQGNDSDEIKEKALFVLSQIETSEAQNLLLEVARSGSPGLREDAVRMIGISGEPDAVAALAELYRAGDEDMREAVLEARDGAHFWTLGYAGKPGEGPRTLRKIKRRLHVRNRRHNTNGRSRLLHAEAERTYGGRVRKAGRVEGGRPWFAWFWSRSGMVGGLCALVVLGGAIALVPGFFRTRSGPDSTVVQERRDAGATTAPVAVSVPEPARVDASLKSETAVHSIPAPMQPEEKLSARREGVAVAASKPVPVSEVRRLPRRPRPLEPGHPNRRRWRSRRRPQR